MPELKPILLAEDNPSDAELTLEALADNKLANRVTLVRDGSRSSSLPYRFRCKQRVMTSCRQTRVHGMENEHGKTCY